MVLRRLTVVRLDIIGDGTAGIGWLICTDVGLRRLVAVEHCLLLAFGVWLLAHTELPIESMIVP